DARGATLTKSCSHGNTRAGPPVDHLPHRPQGALVPRTAQPTAPETTIDRSSTAELDRQLETLLRLGYPALMGMSEAELSDAVGRLAARLPCGPSTVAEEDHVPFVVAPRTAPLRETALLTTKDDRPAALM